MHTKIVKMGIRSVENLLSVAVHRVVAAVPPFGDAPPNVVGHHVAVLQSLVGAVVGSKPPPACVHLHLEVAGIGPESCVAVADIAATKGFQGGEEPEYSFAEPEEAQNS